MSANAFPRSVLTQTLTLFSYPRLLLLGLAVTTVSCTEARMDRVPS